MMVVVFMCDVARHADQVPVVIHHVLRWATKAARIAVRVAGARVAFHGAVDASSIL